MYLPIVSDIMLGENSFIVTLRFFVFLIWNKNWDLIPPDYQHIPPGYVPGSIPYSFPNCPKCFNNILFVHENYHVFSMYFPFVSSMYFVVLGLIEIQIKIADISNILIVEIFSYIERCLALSRYLARLRCLKKSFHKSCVFTQLLFTLFY